MKIAVVTTAHNEGPMLYNAVRSVFNQSIGVAEYVIVVDGGDEPTRQVADLHTGSVDQVLQVTHRGMPAARNAGLLALRSNPDAVLFLDADDHLAENFIEEIDYGFADDAAACIPSIVRHCAGQVSDPALPSVIHPTLAQMWDWCHGYSCGPFRYTDLIEVGGFHPALSGDCDWGMWIDLLARGKRISYAPRAHYHYLEHDKSYTRTVATSLQPQHRAIMHRVFNLAAHGLSL